MKKGEGKCQEVEIISGPQGLRQSRRRMSLGLDWMDDI